MNLSSRDYMQAHRRQYWRPLQQKTSRCRFPAIMTADKVVETGLNNGVVNGNSQSVQQTLGDVETLVIRG